MSQYDFRMEERILKVEKVIAGLERAEGFYQQMIADSRASRDSLWNEIKDHSQKSEVFRDGVNKKLLVMEGEFNDRLQNMTDKFEKKVDDLSHSMIAVSTKMGVLGTALGTAGAIIGGLIIKRFG